MLLYRANQRPSVSGMTRQRLTFPRLSAKVPRTCPIFLLKLGHDLC